MDYEMEELIPIVGRLAQKYTGLESTSITYEKAEQLMEAVLYCIHEGESEYGPALLAESLPAGEAYRIGVECVEKKTKKALDLYHEILTGFMYYENRCLYDTFIKGIPGFFRWYDIKFAPQDTILTLDYPVLKDLSGYTGVDRIYEYLICISLEQRFLNRFPEGYVKDILSKYNTSYKHMMDNICEIVLAVVVKGLLNDGSLSEQRLEEKLAAFLKTYYEDKGELFSYFKGAANGILARFKIMAEKREKL